MLFSCAFYAFAMLNVCRMRLSKYLKISLSYASSLPLPCCAVRLPILGMNEVHHECVNPTELGQKGNERISATRLGMLRQLRVARYASWMVLGVTTSTNDAKKSIKYIEDFPFFLSLTLAQDPVADFALMVLVGREERKQEFPPSAVVVG